MTLSLLSILGAEGLCYRERECGATPNRVRWLLFDMPRGVANKRKRKG